MFHSNPVPSGLTGQRDRLVDPLEGGNPGTSQQLYPAATASPAAEHDQGSLEYGDISFRHSSEVPHGPQGEAGTTQLPSGQRQSSPVLMAPFASDPPQSRPLSASQSQPAAPPSRLPAQYLATLQAPTCQPATQVQAQQAQQQQQQQLWQSRQSQPLTQQQQPQQPVQQQQQQQQWPQQQQQAVGTGRSQPHSPHRPRPRPATESALASPPRNAPNAPTNMETIAQRSAARGSRPPSTHVPAEAPGRLMIKIAGAQQPPPGAPIVQKEATAFQQRFGSAKPSTAKPRSATVERLHRGETPRAPSAQRQNPDSSGPSGPYSRRAHAPPHRPVSATAADRPAWARPASSDRPDLGQLPGGGPRSEEEEVLAYAAALNAQQQPAAAQQQQQQQQQQEEGMHAGEGVRWGPSGVSSSAHHSPLRSQSAGASPRSPGHRASGGVLPRYMAWNFHSPEQEEKQRQKKEKEDAFFRRYQIKQHHDDQPDYRYSQSCAAGPQVTLAQHLFSFDETHPGIASQHYKRSKKQELELQAERQALEVKRRKAQHASSQPKKRAPLPSARKLREEVDRMMIDNELGMDAIKRLEQDGGDITAASRAIQQRALDAIESSKHATKRLSRSPSPVGARAYSPSRYSPPARRRGSWSGGAAAAAYPPPTNPYLPAPTFTSAPTAAHPRPQSAPFSPYQAPSHAPPQYGGFSGRTSPTHDGYNSGYESEGGGYTGHGYDGASYGGAGDVSGLPSREPSLQQLGGEGMHEGGPSDASEVLERDRAVQASRDPERAGRSLADHLAKASGIRLQGEEPEGSMLSEQEFRLACGIYDPEKYDEYNRQMDAEMQERALQAGYESDQERQKQAAKAEAYDNLTQEEREYLEAQAREARELEALMQQSWQEQNAWMDQYRTRLGPYEGYGSLSGEGGQQQQGGQEGQGEYAEGELPPFVPFLSEELQREYGPGGTARSKSAPRNKGAKPFQPTVPQPFAFEERAAQRPKTIMKVKSEQDRRVKHMEEEAAKRYRFRANSVPRAVLEPKYNKMLLEAEATRQINREGRMSELGGMMEAPFSFQAADEQRAAIKEAVAALAKNPNRFQIPFKAKAPPKTIHEEKFKFMQMDLENKRSQARARAEEARAKARQRVEEDMQERQNKAVRSYQERLRTVDPIWNQKYDTKLLGAVPDFNMLHMQWEQRMATLRALNRRRATVPYEFHVNGGTAEQRKAQEQKALERRQRIILDMALDDELLPEQRWPHKSARGRVRPKPPPAFEKPDFKVNDTKSNMLRIAATRKAREYGQFDEKDQREAKELERMKKEAEIRAKLWVKQQTKERVGALQYQEGAEGGSSPGPDIAASYDQQPDSGVQKSQSQRPNVRERREALAERTDAPVLHIEARHAQVEAQVRGMVEDALLARGVDAYNAYRE